MSFLKSLLFHPLLFGIVPVLSLLALNQREVRMIVGLRAVLISALLAGVLLVVARALCRDGKRAAIATTFLLVLFFSYGHVYNALKPVALSGVLIGRHRYLGPAWLGVALVGSWWILRRLKDPAALNEALNVAALAALAFPLVQIIAGQLAQSRLSAVETGFAAQEAGLRVPAGDTPPDIYYIVLDGYARDDVLMDVFGYDNAAFLEGLQELGFYVARCSLSNYAQSELSVASSLNYNHLEALGDRFTPENEDRSGLAGLIRDNAVRRILKDLGYTDVAFETGYSWIELDDAEVYYAAGEASSLAASVAGGLSNFELMFLRTTAGLLVTDATGSAPGFIARAVSYPNRVHRERVLFVLESLQRVPKNLKSPLFVYAHIVSPHEPYVFGPDGEVVTYTEPLDLETYRRAYRDQVHYLNGRVLSALDTILTSSHRPPVVILQADHGIGSGSSEQRMAILNAYFLPEGAEGALYPEISPVNSFRVVFNTYFEGELPLLADISRFSTYEEPYDFRVIPGFRAGCAE